MTLKSRIKTYRNQMGWTQKQCAERLTGFGSEYGVTFSTGDIANYEGGHASPNGYKAIVLCKALRMRVSTYEALTGKVLTVSKTMKPKLVVPKTRSRRYNGVGGKNIVININ